MRCVNYAIEIPFLYSCFSYKKDLQVVHYTEGGQFKVHHDSSSFHPRLLTSLFYLNSPSISNGGGETWFPFAKSSLNLPEEEITEDSLETTKNAIWLEWAQYRPREGRWAFLAF